MGIILIPAPAFTETFRPGIGGNSVGENAEHNGANRSRSDDAGIGHVGVYHDDGEHNTGQTTRTEPTHKKLALGAHTHTGEREKNG